MAKFFDLPADSNCYSLKYVDKELQVWASADIHSEMLHIGTARFEGKDAMSVEPVVTLWLPDQQSVYPPNPNRHGRVLYGSFIQHSHRKGLYKTVSGQIERQISMIQSPSFDRNKIGGILDGKLLIDIL